MLIEQVKLSLHKFQSHYKITLNNKPMVQKAIRCEGWKPGIDINRAIITGKKIIWFGQKAIKML